MANSNFIVHNGLQVGPLVISAATGDITTTGAITVSGGGAITGAAAGSLSGATLASGVTASSLTSVGTLTSLAVTNAVTAASLNVSGNVLASSLTGTLTTASQTNITAVGTLASLAISGAATIGGPLTISGNLFVNGTTTTFNSNNLTINDSMIYMADDNSADTLDIGIVSSFTNAGYQHTGLVRDATDGRWKLFKSVTDEPTTTVNFAQATWADLQVGVLYGTAQYAQYADLAEKYLADAAYEPGTVLDFGGEQEVTQAVSDMSARIAGVVSTDPAYMMNSDLAGNNVVVVALTGRVPCKVTGTVSKGDMMVSAGNGRARAEANPKVGSVIGKALENSEGDAVIEVVVGKH